MKIQQNIIIPIIVAVIFGGGGFYAGMQYSQSKSSTRAGNLQNLTPAQRQAFQQNGGMMRGVRAGGQSGGGFVSGDIISKDDKSITIKLRDGSTKIVFYSTTTEISKFVSGLASDLETGKTVSVTGTTGQDGSISAQSIQLRPNIPAPTPATK